MRAIISDIHGNLEALEAALADIRSFGVEEIYCLGDVVGKGGKSEEVVRLISKVCSVFVPGNHDVFAVALRGTPLQPDVCTILEDLYKKRLVHWEGLEIYCHGTPRIPLVEYVYSDRALEVLDSELKDGQILFCGHTHKPFTFCDNYLREGNILTDDLQIPPQSRAVVNVGSVGFPEDEFGKCYVLFNPVSRIVKFRKI